MEYNYKITKILDVECVQLTTNIELKQDSKVLTNGTSYTLYDNYSRTSGSEFTVKLGVNETLKAENKRFVILFNLKNSSEKLTDVIKVSGTESFVDLSASVKAKGSAPLLDYVKQELTLEQVNGKLLNSDTTFFLRRNSH